jgi:hypothetical protein
MRATCGNLILPQEAQLRVCIELTAEETNHTIL